MRENACTGHQQSGLVGRCLCVGWAWLLIATVGCLRTGTRQQLLAAIEAEDVMAVTRAVHSDLASASRAGEGSGGIPPLVLAALAGNVDIARVLLEARAPVNQRTASGDTALHGASLEGHAAMVAFLTEAGADPNAKNERGLTPLHSAAFAQPDDDGREDGYGQVVRLLILAGADPDKKDHGGRSPLHDAAAAGNLAAIRALVAAGVDPNCLASSTEGEAGKTPIFDAVVSGEVDAARLLHRLGASVESPRWGDSVLRVAASAGRQDIATFLIRSGADVDRRERECGISPLCSAASRLRADMCRLLLAEGADVDLPDNLGNTPLISVLNYGLGAPGEGRVLETVRVLLEGGADVTKVNREGLTAVDIARSRGYTKVVSLLLGAAAAVEPGAKP